MRTAKLLAGSIFIGMVLSGSLPAQVTDRQPPRAGSSLAEVTGWLCDFLKSSGFTKGETGGNINKVEFSNGFLYLSGPSSGGGHISYSIPLKDVDSGSLSPVQAADSYETLEIDTLNSEPTIIVWDSTLSGCEGRKAAGAKILFRSHAESVLFVRGLKQAAVLYTGRAGG